MNVNVIALGNPMSEELKPLNKAPENSLPSWKECMMRVDNSEYIAKRVSEGGGGWEWEPEPYYKANPIHEFIYEYDDKDPYKSEWFLHRLEKLIDFVKSQSHWIPCKERLPEPSSENKLRSVKVINQDGDSVYYSYGYKRWVWYLSVDHEVENADPVVTSWAYLPQKPEIYHDT